MNRSPHDDRHHHRRPRPRAGPARHHRRLHAPTPTAPGHTLVRTARRWRLHPSPAGPRTELTLTDRDGDACAHLLLFAAGRPWERLNAADTVKVQWNAYLGAGSLLLSDQGRVLAALTADSSGRHDALTGTSSAARNTARYGDGSPHGPSPAGRELFKLAAVKHGLTPRDLPPSISLFQGVTVAGDGTLVFTGSAGPGAAVTLRAEQPLIVLLANVPHPLDPRPGYHCTPLAVRATAGKPTAPGDPLYERTPEGRRAYQNTDAREDLA